MSHLSDRDMEGEMSGARSKVSGFFPDGKVMVVGLPPNFKLLEKLEQADSIRLAMAFCHTKGWTRWESAIGKCNGSIQLITGLDFCQTEPALLRTWNQLSINPQFRPRLMTSGSRIFHPKVLIVSSKNSGFALIGSGNLSEGGLRTNI